MDKRLAGSIVRKAGWLSKTPIPFQDLVLARCDVLRFEKAERIYDAGDDAGGLFGVVEGGLEIHLPWRGSKTTLSHIGGPGFWTGAGTAITGKTRRVAIAARASSWLLRLPRLELIRITREDPSALIHFDALNVRNLFLAIDIINALKRDDAFERLAATLLNLVGYASGKRPLIHVSQSDLAAIAGLARSSVNVALADLEQHGWLRRRYAALEITDLSALRRFVEGG